MNRERCLAVVIAFVGALGGACDQEQLVVLVPRIELCPSAEAPEASCGVDVEVEIDLGRLVVAAAHDANIFIVNRGDGTLLVREASAALDSVTVGALPERVRAGGNAALPLVITLAESALGPGSAVVSVLSSDAETPTAAVTVAWQGIPPPRGDVLLCDASLPEAPCGTAIDVDFGSVRPTQSTSRLVLVRNGGETDLAIEELRVDGADFALASSSRPAILAPGEEGSIVVVFTGNGAGRREAQLVVRTDDPDAPEAIARLSGSVGDNLAPTAIAVESVSGLSTATALVAQLVGVDGTASRDPEGDPLAFQWTLAPPPGSVALLEDSSSQNALFVPDVRGRYTVTLVVTDSILQPSAPVSVEVDVLARFKARARLHWAAGGDVDLHLVQSGSAPFSAADCSFDNRIVGDAELLDDDTASPGLEEAVLAAPSAGAWEVWAQLFDDGGLGPVGVTVEIVVDDAAPAALALSATLPATCAIWHAADLIVAPDGSVSVVDVSAAVASSCPP